MGLFSVPDQASLIRLPSRIYYNLLGRQLCFLIQTKNIKRSSFRRLENNLLLNISIVNEYVYPAMDCRTNKINDRILITDISTNFIISMCSKTVLVAVDPVVLMTRIVILPTFDLTSRFLRNPKPGRVLPLSKHMNRLQTLPVKNK